MTLLVMDIQKGITDDRLYDLSGFVESTTRIVSAARENGVEVIYVQHDDGPGTGFSTGDDDFEIAEYIRPHDGEKVYIKSIKSCFGNRELVRYLEEKAENTLMIIGLMTNFCIDASIRSAFDRGYKVIVPNGANSTFDNDYMDRETTYRYYNEMMWPDRFAQCVSAEEAVKMLISHDI